MASLLASALAGVLVGASLADSYGLAAGVVLVQVLLLVGLVRTADVPAGPTSAAVAFVVALASVAVLTSTAESSFDLDALLPLLVAFGVGFVALTIVQLARRDGRDRLTGSLTFGVTAVLLSVATAGWLALGDGDIGTALLLLALAGTATGAAMMIFPGPSWLWVIGGTIAAASVGLIMQAYAPPVDGADLGPVVASVVAGACGFAAGVGVRAARLLRDEQQIDAEIAPPRLDHALVAAALPVALAAPVAVAAAWAVAEGLLA